LDGKLNLDLLDTTTSMNEYDFGVCSLQTLQEVTTDSPEASSETVQLSKGPITEVAQGLYERCFKEKAGYPFTFEECAIEIMLFSRANYLTESNSRNLTSGD
jgi:hypothetical protein